MFFPAVVLSAALVATQAMAATQTVMVGQGGFVFTPNTVTAASGDTVTFQFAGAHSATQSSFNDPCDPLSGGFDSGILASSQSFSVQINDTQPVWVYCKQPGHCQGGMVFAINAPAQGNTFDAFKNKAEGISTPSSSASSSVGSASSSPSSSAPSASASPSSTNSGSGSSRLTVTYGLSALAILGVGVSAVL